MLIDPFCLDCIHLINAKKTTCKAFPNGIPKNIFLTEISHEKKLPEQIGDFVFEPVAKWEYLYKK